MSVFELPYSEVHAELEDAPGEQKREKPARWPADSNITARSVNLLFRALLIVYIVPPKITSSKGVRRHDRQSQVGRCCKPRHRSRAERHDAFKSSIYPKRLREMKTEKAKSRTAAHYGGLEAKDRVCLD